MNRSLKSHSDLDSAPMAREYPESETLKRRKRGFFLTPERITLRRQDRRPRQVAAPRCIHPVT